MWCVGIILIRLFTKDLVTMNCDYNLVSNLIYVDVQLFTHCQIQISKSHWTDLIVYVLSPDQVSYVFSWQAKGQTAECWIVHPQIL